MLAIMQPYFLPYIGHFSLHYSASRWIIFDLPKYAPKTYVSRNWFQLPTGQVVRLGLFVKHRRGQSIGEAEVTSLREVRNAIDGPVRQYYPYSSHAKDLHECLMDSISDSPSNRVVDVNQTLLRAITGFLGFQRPMRLASSLDIDLKGVLGAGDWAPTIACSVGERNYVNPLGGAKIFDDSSFERFDVKLWFHQFIGRACSARVAGTEIKLSILNDILERGADQVRLDLLDFELVKSRSIEPSDPR